MAFLDRFRTAKPSTGGRTTPSGRSHTNGFLEYDELNARLIGSSGLRVFDEMWRTDGDVRKAWSMCINPISGATWSVEPYGGEEAEDRDREVAAFVEWALWEYMSPRLSSHVNQALRMLRAGFVPFEQVWDAAEYEGRTVLAPCTLDAKLPRSVQQWNTTRGVLESVTLYVSPSDTDADNTAPEISAEDLVYYRLGAEGDNWEGESPLRPAYKHWKYKNALELIDTMAHERFAMGVPIGYPPNADASEDIDAMADALAGIRANEQGYILAPGPAAQFAEKGQGWHFDILQPANTHDVSGSLKYHSDRIAASLIEEFMRLGQEQTGARATAESQSAPFQALLEAIATTVIADTLNEQLIPRLVALNYDVEGLPALTFSLEDSAPLSELADYVGKLSAAGALHADNDLEDHLRRKADLPPADAEARAEREKQAEEMRQAVAGANQPGQPSQPSPPSQPPSGGDTGATPPPDKQMDAEPESALALARSDRALRDWEQVIQLDRIEATLDGAREGFVQAGAPASYALAARLAENFAHRRRKDPTSATAPTELVDALDEELRTIYRVGRETVAAELDAQRSGDAQPVPNMLADVQPPDDIANRARLAAQATAQAIQSEMARAALTERDQGALQAAGEAAARGALRAESQQHAASALNAGRIDEANAQSHDVKGVYYTSVLDARRCQNCAIADDDVLRSMSDPVRLRHIPPNHECFGGMKCRCVEAYVLMDEAPAALEADQTAEAIKAQAEATTKLAVAVGEQKPAEVKVDVAPAEVKLEPHIDVAAPEAPVVNVNVPEPPKRRTRVLRDDDGNMTGTEEY